MIFTKEHIALVLAGEKTMTRRLGKKRWTVGHVHPVKCSRFEKARGYVRILDTTEEPLGNTTEADAKAEGYSSLENYKAAWERIFKTAWNDDLLVWVVTFCVYDGPPPKREEQSTLFDSLEEVSP